MAKVISISEILGTINDGAVEVCATAETDYDPATAQLVVTLDAFTRQLCAVGESGHQTPSWLPRGERVTEHLPREDAATFAKDVFHSWVRKVRASVPVDQVLRK